MQDKNLLHLVRMRNRRSRYAVLRGGTRSGKTYAALRFIAAHALLGSFRICSVVAESIPHLRRGAQRDFNEIIRPFARFFKHNVTNREYEFASGAKVEFFSADDASRLRGAQRDWLFVNEVNLIKESEFTELDIRTREFVIVDFNPIARFWLNDLFAKMGIELSEVEIVTTYRDNPYLAKEQIAAIERRAANEEWYKVYGLGEWGESQGQAWYTWEVGEVEWGEWDVVGVDFGEGRSPSAVVGVRRRGEKLAAREIAYTHAGLHEIADILKSVRARRIVGDSAQMDFINLLRKYDVNIYAARKMHLVASFALINSVQTIIHRESENFLKEAQSVCWADRGAGLIQAGVADHALDAFRYAAHELL